MTDEKKMEASKAMFDKLMRLRGDTKDRWAVYFLGVQIYPSTSKIYSSEGIARSKIVDIVEGCVPSSKPKVSYPPYPKCSTYGTDAYKKENERYNKLLKEYRKDQRRIVKERRDKTRELLKEFENCKILEFRLSNSIEPLFPHSVITEESTADRVKQMLNAKDGEMFNLAMAIIKELTKKG